MIAALYVERGGVYFDLPGVDPWDESRDARLYAGPFPVVVHPPCARWSRFAGQVERTRGLRRGNDGGCFAAALAAVRRWGGVLEHPQASSAWRVFDLPVPPSRGWALGLSGDWVCEVSQAAYGHSCEKLTWLLYRGKAAPPVLDWSRPVPARSVVSLHSAHRLRTPLPFRDLLVSMAGNCGELAPDLADAATNLP
jgi:hypothetical protein